MSSRCRCVSLPEFRDVLLMPHRDGKASAKLYRPWRACTRCGRARAVRLQFIAMIKMDEVSIVESMNPSPWNPPEGPAAKLGQLIERLDFLGRKWGRIRAGSGGRTAAESGGGLGGGRHKLDAGSNSEQRRFQQV